MPLCSAAFLGLGSVSSLTLSAYKPTPSLPNTGRSVASAGGPTGSLPKAERPWPLCGQSPTPPPGRKGLQTTCELMAFMKDFFDQRNKSGGGKASAFRQRVLRLQTQHPKHPSDRAARCDRIAGRAIKEHEVSWHAAAASDDLQSHNSWAVVLLCLPQTSPARAGCTSCNTVPGHDPSKGP